MKRLESPRDMAEAHVTVQRARTARACEDYPGTGCVIAKGDEYVTWTIFPGSDILHGLTRPSRMSICLGHSPEWVRDEVVRSSGQESSG